MSRIKPGKDGRGGEEAGGDGAGDASSGGVAIGPREFACRVAHRQRRRSCRWTRVDVGTTRYDEDDEESRREGLPAAGRKIDATGWGHTIWVSGKIRARKYNILLG